MGQGNSRNKPCPCGSGQKAKACCLGRKPRTTSVTFQFEQPVSLTGFEFGANGRIVPLVGDRPVQPESAFISTSYERPKGPKVLNQVPLAPASATYYLDYELIKWDILFAIDTNTRKIRRDQVSVTCVTMCKFNVGEFESRALFSPFVSIEFRNLTGPFENAAWRVIVDRLHASPDFHPNLKIGIIVDADLSEIPAYNARKKPLHGDYYLPIGFELFYASSDAGKESLPNILLARSDREANALLRLIDEDPSTDHGLVACPVISCSRTRVRYPVTQHRS